MAADPSSVLASRVPRAEAVARDLEAEILGGRLTPGDRLGTKDDLRQRIGLEPLVCREAARHVTTAEARELRAIVDHMERCAGDPRAYFELNWTLHRCIARLGHNAPLHSIYLTLLDFIEDGTATDDLRRFDATTDVEVHRELVAAIAEGPGPRLDAAIERPAELTAPARAPRSGPSSPR